MANIPLLHRRSSGSSSAGGGTTGEEKVTAGKSRQVAFGLGTRFEKAAALVDKAMDGEGLPPELLRGLQEGGNFAHFSYFLFSVLEPLWNVNLLLLFLLNFFEVPLWCKSTFPNPCQDDGRYNLSGWPFLSQNLTLSLEILTAMVFLVQSLFPLLYTCKRRFWSVNPDSVQVLLAVFLSLDVLVYFLYLWDGGPITSLSFRAAPYLRVLAIIVSATNLRRMLVIFSSSFVKFLDIGVILFAFLGLSSLLGFVLFEDSPQGQEMYRTFQDTFYQLSVLLQTQNSPDPWLPAYRNWRPACLFFVLFLTVGLYFVMNLVLAVIFDCFKDKLSEDYEEEKRRGQATLEHSFDILEENKCGFLSFAQIQKLLVELNRFRLLPLVREENVEAILTTMDDSHDQQISKREFLDICKIISLRFREPREPLFLETYFPRYWNSASVQRLKGFVESDGFEALVWAVLLLNLCTVVVETSLDVRDSQAQRLWIPVEHAIGWLYVLELALRVGFSGVQSYWKSFQNRFDASITLLIFVGELVLIFGSTSVSLQSQEWIRYLLIARLFRLTRLLTAIPRYRVILCTFFSLIPGLVPLIMLLFFMLCLFNIAGMQLFGGLLYSGNPNLKGTNYDDNNYYVLHFNDFPSGLVLLFNVLVTSGDPSCLEALAVLTEGSWSPFLYFSAFYYVCVAFVLQLVASFVLDAFFVQKSAVERSMATEYVKTEEGLEVEAGSIAGSARQIMERMFETGTSDVRGL